ncbi:MAG: ABC transporter ATP-binding protein/permease [Crocinitomicaceae bacterium]|nr:ABC transporter ATP-binding protein/permease [Crocinitomicaceae bacterium]
MSPLFYLNKYLKRYKWRLILGALFILISNHFKLKMPVVLRDTVNDIFEYSNSGIAVEYEVILKLGLIAAGMFMLFSFLQGFFLFLTRQTIIVMSRFIEFDLKNEIYKHYQKLPFNFYKKNSTGDLMNRVSEDVTKVRMYLGPGIMYTVNLLCLFVLGIIQMFSVNPELTLYALAPLPVMSVLIYFVSSTINRKSEQVQRQQSKLSTIVQESFAGIRVLKSHIREKFSLKSFEVESEAYKDKSVSLEKTNAFFMPTIMVLIGMSNILTVYIGGKQVQAETIPPGQIAEFIYYVNLLTWPFASVGWVTSVIQRAAASQQRINEFLAAEPERDDRYGLEHEFEDSIVFKDVSLKYENSGIEAVKNLNLSIKKGDTLGIIGKTGSGKSSIAYLLTQFVQPTMGRILMDGVPIKDIQLRSWRKNTSYVPQDHFLFSDSIKNNILFGIQSGEVDEAKLIEAAKQADIHENIMNFPDQYEILLGERGINLSGGQKQRVSIARAFIKNSDLLILDDALSAVDTETEERILNTLKSKNASQTKVIITHRISSIKYADKIIVLDEGKLIEEGTHSELLALEGAYFKIHKKQELQKNEN